MHLLTSNFNLLHTNSGWDKLKNHHNFFIDKDFDNFFFLISNPNELKRYDSIHILINNQTSNIKKTAAKIKNLLNIFKKNKNKRFFFYLIGKKNKEIDFYFKKKISKNSNLKSINIRDIVFNNRNKVTLKFPFDVKMIENFSSNILKNNDLIKSKPYKLIILDCDNTLWDGVLDEDHSNISYTNSQKSIFFQFQKFLKNLKAKGFLLSISSKNDEKKVWKLMKHKKMVLQKKDFLYSKINWEDKGFNIKQIINQFNIREQDVLFIDDNIVEINKVKLKLKKINVHHFKKDLNFLKFDNRLTKINILKEDKNKYYQYRLKSKFDKLKTINTDSLDFLKDLKQSVKIKSCNKNNIKRAIQLSQKTNQFNFSLKRYDKTSLVKIMKSKDKNVQLIEFKDKFGNHGTVGLYTLILKESKFFISDFLFSCRVLNRYIEQYIIYLILSKINKTQLYIIYNKTKINDKLVPKFLKNDFFKLCKKDGKKQIYKIKKTNKLLNAKKYFTK